MRAVISIAAAADLALVVYGKGMDDQGKPTFTYSIALLHSSFSIILVAAGELILECIVYNTEKLEIIQRSSIALSRCSTLKWIGFSETSVT